MVNRSLGAWLFLPANTEDFDGNYADISPEKRVSSLNCLSALQSVTRQAATEPNFLYS